MAETPEQLYARAAGHLRTPAVEEWDTWPFRGGVVPKELERPVSEEPPRMGAGGSDCRICEARDADYIWTDDRWRIRPIKRPNGLPLVLFLEPREHYGEPGDLPDDLARECGFLIARVERAVRSLEGVGRVHVCRWGDGAEHAHWWFMARPARMPQLIGSFAAIWDDVLPPTPQDVWNQNLADFLAAFAG